MVPSVLTSVSCFDGIVVGVRITQLRSRGLGLVMLAKCDLGGWDGALMMAQAMTAHTRPGGGTTNESHWTERAGSLLGPLLYAANQAERPVGEVLRRVQRPDLTPALEILADCEVEMAADAMIGIQRTRQPRALKHPQRDQRRPQPYKSAAIQQSAAHPNFGAERFVRGADTIYVTAPGPSKALRAAPRRPLRGGPPRCLELSATGQMTGPAVCWRWTRRPNIALMPDPLALLSQADGQGLKVYFGLQDIAQAASVWGQPTADAS
jgi:hypothetical protein